MLDAIAVYKQGKEPRRGNLLPPTDCPIHVHELIIAFMTGKFKPLEGHPFQQGYLGVEYTGYIWQPKDGVDVVADHGPGGLEIQCHVYDMVGNYSCFRTSIMIEDSEHENLAGEGTQWERIAP